jgi:hypothetical protein
MLLAITEGSVHYPLAPVWLHQAAQPQSPALCLSASYCSKADLDLLHWPPVGPQYVCTHTHTHTHTRTHFFKPEAPEGHFWRVFEVTRNIGHLAYPIICTSEVKSPVRPLPSTAQALVLTQVTGLSCCCLTLQHEALRPTCPSNHGLPVCSIAAMPWHSSPACVISSACPLQHSMWGQDVTTFPTGGSGLAVCYAT